MTPVPEAMPVKAAAPSRRWSGWSVEPLLTPGSRALALIAFLASIVMPTEGLGFDICVVHRATGLPCPGCGLTRGVTAITHGHLDYAFVMNPFSFVVWAVFLVLTLTLVLPAKGRAALLGFARTHSNFFGAFYKYSIIAFLIFGTVRFMYFLLRGQPFP